MATQTMQALDLGTKTLRTLISSPSLSLDHIEETTSALSDALADANEINEAVSQVGQLDSTMESEVEDELKELVETAEREERAEQDRKRVEREQAEREGEAESKAVRESSDRDEQARLKSAEAALSAHSAPSTDATAASSEPQASEDKRQEAVHA